MDIALDLLKAKHIGVRELKEGLSAFLKKDAPLVVTEHGAPTRVIVPYDEMLELLDILEEIDDTRASSLVAEGRRALREGAKGIPVFKAGE
jgi:PHD/YefM family antitoxin component YafN of YafNO toxin-antitoxin module